MRHWREVERLGDFLVSPATSILRHRAFGLIGVMDDFIALVAWGALSTTDVQEALGIAHAASELERWRDLLLDVSRVRAIEHDGLSRLLAFQREGLLPVRASAAVVPGGVVGVTLRGLIHVLSPSTPVTTRIEDALARFGRVESQILIECGDALASADDQGRSVLFQLRDLLCKRALTTTVESAAAELGMSVRTLQRRLNEANTAFERERALACIARAKALLARSDLAVKAIAAELGLPSSVRLVQLFRQYEKTTPLKWRSTLRREGDRWARAPKYGGSA